MVSFDHTWPPAAACAIAALMLGAHLVLRLLARPIEFPPLPWLREARRALPLLRRRRAALDFAFALAAVLLAGLLCGHPRIGVATRAAAIVLLDTSLSMGGGGERSGVAAGVRRAAEILAGLADEDRVNLALCGGDVRWAYPSAPAGLDRGPVRRLLESAAPGHGGGALAAAIEDALARLAQAPEREKALYVISDFQASSWADVPLPPFPGVAVVPVPVPGPIEDNVAVRIRGRAAAATCIDEGCEIALELENFASVPRSVRLRWELDGRETARDAIELPPRSVTLAAHVFSIAAPGVVRGEAEALGGDALPGDDRVFFTIDAAAERRVGIAGGAPATRAMLARALGGAARLPIAAEPIERRPPSAFDAVIAAGAPREALDPVRALGMPCLVFAAAPAHLPAALAEGLRPERGTFALDTAFAGNAVRELPALAGVRLAARLSGAAYGRVLARFADGAPAAVALPAENLIIAFFGLDADAGDLLARPENAEAAVVFLGELVRLALGDRVPAPRIGREATLALPQRAYRFFEPAGEEIFPPAAPAGAWTRVTLPAASAPGYFEVWHGDRIVAAAPVNAPPEESRPAVDAATLARWRRAAAERPRARERDATGPLLCALFLTACAWLCLATSGRADDNA
ncbi:MAG TPA: hypothetical protein DCM87_20985 [Planctomycetes bacterium]|nr:hypothetical protein [Planctomycetota bacterium]